MRVLDGLDAAETDIEPEGRGSAGLSVVLLDLAETEVALEE